MNESLRLCPFCGGDPYMDDSTGQYAVVCRHCGGSSTEWEAKGNAISAWNRRAEEEENCTLQDHGECYLQAKRRIDDLQERARIAEASIEAMQEDFDPSHLSLRLDAIDERVEVLERRGNS